VDGNSYYIVMKRYNCSLRQWRQNQSKSLNENLSLYLSIYKEFLKSLMTIHSHNVTHYDIKCDNVFLDFNSDTQSHSLSSQFFGADGDEERFRLTIGDFGECKVFSSEKDEFCTRNRGTDYCKSPEMLQLTINTRKDTDKYDRRK
jgi:serine/threonine protein kinase